MLDENHIYGSSRLGIDKRNKLISFYTGNSLPTAQSETITHIQALQQNMADSAYNEISKTGTQGTVL
jgi:hypothetical protein